MKINIPAFREMAKCNEHLNHGPIDIDLGPDVVLVVRCKDCEYSNKAIYGWLWCTAGPCEGKAVLEDFYCKCGKRRVENGKAVDEG